MALYHTYRPQRFADVVGQEHIIQTITNQIRMGKIAHAYLFFGPRGVGKTTLARLIAKAINCPKASDSDIEPDNTSTSAIEISESRSLDVIEIDAASHTGVDHVREHIIENAQFRPTSLQYKVFIIDEVHMLSTSAFNALLKTLEEPPDHVIFILATTELHKIPDTIISRCQRFTFHKLSHTILESYIQDIAKKEGFTLDTDVIHSIIAKSDGCARDALSILDQLLATGTTHITADIASIVLPVSHIEDTLEFLTVLLQKQLDSSFEALCAYIEKGFSSSSLLQETIELLRVVLVVQSGSTRTDRLQEFSDNTKTRIQSLANQSSIKDTVCLLDILLKRYAEIKTSPLPQLPVEMAIAEWCTIHIQASQKVPTDSQPLSPTTASPISHMSEQRHPPSSTSSSEDNISLIPKNYKAESVLSTPVVDTPGTTPSVCTLDQAKQYWEQCIARIEQESPSLVFILKMTDIHTITGSCWYLHVQYTFHKDKLVEVATKKKIEAYLTDIVGFPLSIEVQVNEATVSSSLPNSPNAAIHELAAAFGGDVVA